MRRPPILVFFHGFSPATLRERKIVWTRDNNIYSEQRFPNLAVTMASAAIETLSVHFEHIFNQSGSVIFWVGAPRYWIDAVFF